MDVLTRVNVCMCIVYVCTVRAEIGKRRVYVYVNDDESFFSLFIIFIILYYGFNGMYFSLFLSLDERLSLLCGIHRGLVYVCLRVRVVSEGERINVFRVRRTSLN